MSITREQLMQECIQEPKQSSCARCGGSGIVSVNRVPYSNNQEECP